MKKLTPELAQRWLLGRKAIGVVTFINGTSAIVFEGHKSVTFTGYFLDQAETLANMAQPGVKVAMQVEAPKPMVWTELSKPEPQTIEAGDLDAAPDFPVFDTDKWGD